MTKEKLLEELASLLRGHISAAELSNDPAFLLDLFTCPKCNDLRRKLEKLEGQEDFRRELENELRSPEGKPQAQGDKDNGSS